MKKKTVTQKRLLEAITQIYKEYEGNVHSLDMPKCPLCKAFDNSGPFNIDCGVCPMTVFEGSRHHKCMNRRCRPFNWYDEGKHHFQPLVVDFYKRFIKAVEKMSDEEVRTSDWKFLKAIDNRVYRKHNK